MKNILIAVVTFSILCCGNKKTDNYTLKANCEKIIIQDSIGSKTIHFLISYHNESNKDIVIFANTFNKRVIQSSKYEQAGLFIKGLNVNSPIGQFQASNMFYVNAGKSLKILYSYDERYLNQKIDFGSKNSIKNQIKEITLNYHCNKNVTDSILNKDEFKKLNIVTVTRDFEIDMNHTSIEFIKKLNIEDVIKLTDGKINGR